MHRKIGWHAKVLLPSSCLIRMTSAFRLIILAVQDSNPSMAVSEYIDHQRVKGIRNGVAPQIAPQDSGQICKELAQIVAIWPRLSGECRDMLRTLAVVLSKPEKE